MFSRGTTHHVLSGWQSAVSVCCHTFLHLNDVTVVVIYSCVCVCVCVCVCQSHGFRPCNEVNSVLIYNIPDSLTNRLVLLHHEEKLKLQLKWILNHWSLLSNSASNTIHRGVSLWGHCCESLSVCAPFLPAAVWTPFQFISPFAPHVLKNITHWR